MNKWTTLLRRQCSSRLLYLELKNAVYFLHYATDVHQVNPIQTIQTESG